MARTILLDTGVIVALGNRRDPDHEACAAVWEELRAQLISVDGVLVEASHVLGRVRSGARRAVELALAAKTEIRPVGESAIRRALDLMDRYADVPMDLVDAMLVAIAEEIDVDEILTLDRRGFGHTASVVGVASTYFPRVRRVHAIVAGDCHTNSAQAHPKSKSNETSSSIQAGVDGR